LVIAAGGVAVKGFQDTEKLVEKYKNSFFVISSQEKTLPELPASKIINENQIGLFVLDCSTNYTNDLPPKDTPTPSRVPSASTPAVPNQEKLALEPRKPPKAQSQPDQKQSSQIPPINNEGNNHTLKPNREDEDSVTHEQHAKNPELMTVQFVPKLLVRPIGESSLNNQKQFKKFKKSPTEKKSITIAYS